LGIGSIATQASSSVTITGGSITGITDLAVADGGTGASTLTGVIKGNGTSPFTAATAGTDFYAPGSTDVAVADGGTGASDASGARTNLGLGSIATQSSGSVAITGGSVTGITDIVVADGGTGVSTLTGIVKGNGTSAFSAATAGTDYFAPGGTDIPVADGGTGASSAASARTNLTAVGYTSGDTVPVTDVRSITQAAYNALGTPNANTAYLIVG
jgi:hypothetical protein